MTAAADDGALDLHASTVVVGEKGVLIRGRSGAGKTSLALALVEEAERGGGFARLVADDRTRVAHRGGRLVARPHPALAGRVERRGLGIMAIAHESSCVLGLAVDLVEGAPERMPGPDESRCTIAGVALPRLAVAIGTPRGEAVALIAAALAPSRTAPRLRPYFACQARRDAQDCAGAEPSSRQSSRQRHER